VFSCDVLTFRTVRLAASRSRSVLQTYRRIRFENRRKCVSMFVPRFTLFCGSHVSLEFRAGIGTALNFSTFIRYMYSAVFEHKKRASKSSEFGSRANQASDGSVLKVDGNPLEIFTVLCKNWLHLWYDIFIDCGSRVLSS